MSEDTPLGLAQQVAVLVFTDRSALLAGPPHDPALRNPEVVVGVFNSKFSMVMSPVGVPLTLTVPIQRPRIWNPVPDVSSPSC
jgi:hypothetical protein